MTAEKRLMKVVGKNVRLFRKRLGLPQKQVSALVGYTDHSQIAKIETGVSLPALDKALALAHLFRVPIGSLIGEEPLPPDVSEAAGIVLHLPEDLQHATVAFLRALYAYLEQHRRQ